VWEEREALQVVIRVQQLLMERGLETHEIVLVFKEFDRSGDGQLDPEEFQRALDVLGVRLPPSKVRQLSCTPNSILALAFTLPLALALTSTRCANSSAPSTRTTRAVSLTRSSAASPAPTWTRKWPIQCGKLVGRQVGHTQS